MHVKGTILGSGHSLGTPVIGCQCIACKSISPRNKRTRSGIYLQWGKYHLLFDTPPDLRTQLLREKIEDISHVFYTHTHADHSHGIDDLRPLYFKTQRPFDVISSKEHLETLAERFDYIFSPGSYTAIPSTVVHPIEDGYRLGNLNLEWASLPHGHTHSIAYKIGPFLYATDFREMSTDVRDKWRGKVELMIASGLRTTQHHAHSSLAETIQLFEDLEVKQGIITHLSHEVDYHNPEPRLPPNVVLAYDGLQFDFHWKNQQDSL